LNSTVLGYITTPNKDFAKTIAQKLLTEKLIACANIFSNIESIFFWHGKICTENECVLVIKAPHKNTKKITEKVKEMHEYENPCIIFLPITDGSDDFLNWINK
jgi:periplasmic divalent cation tolerance protein